MVGGGVQNIPEDFEPMPHVTRAYRNSECRTPVILAEEDGTPFQSIAKLARDKGCAVWTIEMTNAKSEQNAIDYIDVGLQNGDWVYLTHLEEASSDVLRRIAVKLSTLAPDPKHYPRREFFRLWLVVDKHIDINRTIDPVVPQLMAQHSIIGKKKHHKEEQEPGSPNEKWLKRLPQEPALFEKEVGKHNNRREKGMDSDSESDCEEPGDNKLVGKWFHRAVDFHNADAVSTVTKASEQIFEDINNDNGDGVRELCKSGQLNLERLRHKPTKMTLLQYACSLEKTEAAKALLEMGCDPNEVRESDGCPVLFMAIESQELIQALIDHEADYNRSFEGYSLEKHPATAPHIARLVSELKVSGR